MLRPAGRGAGLCPIFLISSCQPSQQYSVNGLLLLVRTPRVLPGSQVIVQATSLCFGSGVCFRVALPTIVTVGARAASVPGGVWARAHLTYLLLSFPPTAFQPSPTLSHPILFCSRNGFNSTSFLPLVF